MILIIIAWIFGFLIILSIGAGALKLISRIINAPLNTEYELFYQFWFGFVMLLGILQVVSLFLPMGNTAFLIVLLLAILSLLSNTKGVLRRLSLFCKWLGTLKGLVSFIVIGVILVLISYSSNREVLHGDTFLYHFNGVKWAKDYPAVPGLANLHGRLGFNSSFFLFAAFSEIGVYTSHSAHIALSFLMAACVIHWFFVISNPRQPRAKRVFCMLTSLFLLIHIVTQIDITSLSTDYPMAVLTMIFCLILMDKLDHKLILLLPLAGLIFAFKLSGMLSIGVALMVWAGYLFVLKHKENRRTAKRTCIVSILLLFFVIAGFIIRNIIVSGWLIYPFPIGNLHLPWSVPEPYVLDMMAWIKSYPRMPGGASPESLEGKGFFFWFPHWFNQFKSTMEFDMLCLAMIIFLWSLFRQKSVSLFIYGNLKILLLIGFAASSILFWFISAPELRFGSFNFFILFAVAVALLVTTGGNSKYMMNLATILFICQLVYRLPSYVVVHSPRLFTFAYTKPRKLIREIGSPADEKPPLYIYMPAEGDGCGNSPIPCTPYAGGFLHNHRLIKQRSPGDLSKGFLPIK